MEKNKKHIAIIGGGFGGIKAALELCDHDEFRVTLITNKDYFEYHPTLYRVATGKSSRISKILLEEIFKNKRIRIIVDEATKLDRDKKEVITSTGQTIAYTSVIVALGMVTNYFGIKDLDTYSFSIKSLPEAERFKKHLHNLLMNNALADEHFIVVGGGPTGIELACELPEYISYIRKQHGLHTKQKVHVDLIEAAPRLLPKMHPGVSRSVARRLKKCGVTLYLNKPVQGITADSLLLAGRPIRAHTVVWTAGMSNNPFFKNNSFMLAPNGKVIVDEYLQAWPDVFVIGDSANTTYSGMAQTALHDAKFVSRNLKRKTKGEKSISYKPKHPFYVIPCGNRWAIMNYKHFYIRGFDGWLFRKLADWVGFNDIEPWWKAGERMMEDMKQQDNCITCVTNNS